jgi:hypothetical protein
LDENFKSSNILYPPPSFWPPLCQKQ